MTDGKTILVLGGTGKTAPRVADRLQARAEQALQASDADWTIVRCSWFNQNFSESFFLGPVLAGAVALPAGDRPRAARLRRLRARGGGRRRVQPERRRAASLGPATS